MNHLKAITTAEARLFVREPATWLIAVFLPTIVLVVVGLVFGPRKPDPLLGGQAFLDLFVPSMIVLTLATLGVNTLPVRLAKYRELGVLRRLSTTPASPGALLVAQLIVNVAVALVALGLLVVVANLVFGVPLPQEPLGFLFAFALGMSSVYALGLLVAARARTTGQAAALFLPIFVTIMFLGGVYLPRWLLPEFLVRLGDFTPPGVEALTDAWTGTPPEILPMVVLGAITVAAGVAAARLFRWE